MSKTPVLERNHVNVTGNPDARESLLFVHGFGTDQTAWSGVTPSFEQDYRIILLDNVGAGMADMAAYELNQARYASLRGYAADLLEIMAALGGERFTLVGHSAGAMMALLAANESPQRCARLVMIGASPRYMDDEGYRGGFTPKDLADIHMAMSQNYASWANAFAPLAMGNPDKPGLATYFANTLSAVPQALALKVLMSILVSDHRLDVRQTRVPTLIVHSHEDIVVPTEVAEFLHAQIPGSCLKMINATGHFPHLSNPEGIVAAMKAFGI